MSRRLDDLDARFRLVVFEFLARLTEAGIAVVIVDTLRTPEEHAENLRRRVSWTERSKHLDGLAIDVCPYQVYDASGPDKLQWDVDSSLWPRIGEVGEKLGLRWGGRWKHADMGHFEWNENWRDKLLSRSA